MTREQMAQIWLAAFAFNMGIGARADRDPKDVAEMDAALTAMREVYDITLANTTT